jgi:hypothetical protein
MIHRRTYSDVAVLNNASYLMRFALPDFWHPYAPRVPITSAAGAPLALGSATLQNEDFRSVEGVLTDGLLATFFVDPINSRIEDENSKSQCEEHCKPTYFPHR